MKFPYIVLTLLLLIFAMFGFLQYPEIIFWKGFGILLFF